MSKSISFKFVDDKIDEIVNGDTGESNPNFIYNEEPADDYVGLDLPDISKKEIVKEDIFDEPEPEEKKIKLELVDDIEYTTEEEQIEESSEEEEVSAPVRKIRRPIIAKKNLQAPQVINVIHELPKVQLDSKGKPIKLNKNGLPRKERKPMTEEQKQKCLDNLKKGREKRSKQKAIEVEQKEIEQPKQKQKQTSISKQDLKEAQLDAIMQYDSLRKARKKKKKEAQLIVDEQEKLKNTLRQEINNTPNWKQTAGKWSGYY
tara:strand:+ start:2612 stop:3391 length:780 start_codon:yes stop_codon:yes gene_type:complete